MTNITREIEGLVWAGKFTYDLPSDVQIRHIKYFFGNP